MYAVNSNKAESRIYTTLRSESTLGLTGVMPKVWLQGSKKNFFLLRFFAQVARDSKGLY